MEACSGNGVMDDGTEEEEARGHAAVPHRSPHLHQQQRANGRTWRKHDQARSFNLHVQNEFFDRLLGFGPIEKLTEEKAKVASAKVVLSFNPNLAALGLKLTRP
jgi:hypothetical protein